MKTCSVEGCERAYYAKGYCAGHYQRSHSGGGEHFSAPIGTSGRGEKVGGFHVYLDEDARALLVAMARRERRRVTDQAAIMIRRGLGLPDFTEDE